MVRDEAMPQGLADRYAATYVWHFTARDGALYGNGGSAIVYASPPRWCSASAKELIQPDPLALRSGVRIYQSLRQGVFHV
jgi:hypothetical protein